MIKIKVNEKYNIPKTPGIYYFFINSEIVYIGLSKNIRNRIFNHFSDNFTKYHKIEYRKITHIGFIEEKGSLKFKENIEIEKHKPRFNYEYCDKQMCECGHRLNKHDYKPYMYNYIKKGCQIEGCSCICFKNSRK